MNSFPLPTKSGGRVPVAQCANLKLIPSLVFSGSRVVFINRLPNEFKGVPPPLLVRDMDVVCALAGARRGRGFEPRFVCPSRGPSARSPPPPPSAARSTIGTAGGWVACLVLVVFLSTVCSIPKFLCQSVSPVGTKKAMHQAQHTCSSAPRHRYRLAPPEAHLLVVLLGLRPGGFEPLSSGQQLAAQPLWYMARKPALCITDLMNEMPEPPTLNRRLGLRPPHTNHALPRHTSW